MRTMSEVPDVLLDRIYDAAADVALWPAVLTDVADLLRSEGGILFGQTISAGAVHFEHNGRLDESCSEAYKQGHLQNPWSAYMDSQPVGVVVPSDRVLPVSQLKRTAFYDAVLRPQGVAHNAMAALANRDGFCGALNICRSASQGAFDEADLSLLGRVVPHLHRSFQLGYRLEGYRALQQAQYEILDKLAAGVLLLDRRARILFANRAAAALLAPGGLLKLHLGVPTVATPQAGPGFAKLLRSVLQGAPAASMSLPSRGLDGLATIFVSSVRGRDLERFAAVGAPDPAVLLFVTEPAAQASARADTLREAYGLTPAEARVALHAAAGGSDGEVGSRLGISVNTVKTHLSRVYRKTGVRRRAELARLMAALGQISPGP
jgi:DNA-binding CsgD family transcriptional regulator